MVWQQSQEYHSSAIVVNDFNDLIQCRIDCASGLLGGVGGALVA
jgi:hypothetical protein